MRGISVLDRDERGVVTVNLRDLLHLAGAKAEESEWELRNLECIGDPEADECHRLSNSNEKISGNHLIRLASGLAQVIDGEFLAFQQGESEPWLIIRAVDSSAYDVESEDEALLNMISKRFKDVVDIPT